MGPQAQRKAPRAHAGTDLEYLLRAVEEQDIDREFHPEGVNSLTRRYP
jgi:hypothetical protein